MEQQYELKLDVETHTPERSKRRRAKPDIVSDKNKSSRQERVHKRNREIIARYYYWTEVRRRRFDDVMWILTDEFYVEERTISNALLDFSDYLDELYKDKKDIRELRKDYPSRSWDSN